MALTLIIDLLNRFDQVLDVDNTHNVNEKYNIRDIQSIFKQHLQKDKQLKRYSDSIISYLNINQITCNTLDRNQFIDQISDHLNNSKLRNALNKLYNSIINVNRFAIPSKCHIQTQLVGISMEELLEWRSLGAVKPHSASHVAILYFNELNNKLYVAIHQRTKQFKNGGGRLGWPGGIADFKNETVWQSTLREIKEECMSKTDVSEKDLHLLYCKKTSENPIQFYALFVLFINDLCLLTGPDQVNEWELMENKSFGMIKKNGYHNFFSWERDENTNKIKLVDSIYKMDTDQYENATRKIWGKSAMKTLYYCVKCDK
eukprot:268468_1